MASLCPVPILSTYNPFTLNGNRTLGTDWKLPSVADLRQLNYTAGPRPGYGCFQCPDYPLGTPLLPQGKGNATAFTADELCPRGFFCPYLDAANPLTFPVYCPPSGECLATRLGTYERCLNPQGYYEPMACPDRLLLPDIQHGPPEGSFCISGSTTEPTQCQFMSYCPPGSHKERHYGFIVLVLVIDIVILAVYLFFRLREIKANGEPVAAIIPYALRKLVVDVKEYFKKKDDTKSSTTKSSEPQTSVTSIPKNASTAETIASTLSVLTSGFSKGLEGHTDLRMNYQFQDLGLQLATGTRILQGVSGSIQSGRMTAIMGPSGSGKTTFMNVLMGKVSRTDGELKINSVVAEMSTYRKIIGYVPQEDIMLTELTVKENLMYSANVRLPGTWSRAEVEEHVNALLKALNLSHVTNSRIGSSLDRGISGGQRKRVNIGLELAAVPLSVFLDEPTSGLDSTAALDVVHILKSISRLGLTIVSVIHQPRLEIFEAFDDVLMVAPGGRTAYIGPVNEVQTYFQSLGFLFDDRLNPADVLMDILSGRGELADGFPHERVNVDNIVAQWKIHLDGKRTKGEPAVSVTPESETGGDEMAIQAMKRVSQLRGSSFFRQVLLSHNRSMLQQMRLVAAFVMEAFLGALAGYMMGMSVPDAETYQGILNGQFAVLSGSQDAVFLAMTGMINGIAIALIAAPPGVKVFGEEKEVYYREAAAGHSKLAYFVGKNLSVVYRIALAAAHFVAVFYVMARPPIYIGYQYAAMFLNFFGIYGMAQIISMFIRRENAPLMAVTVGMIFGVLNGFAPTLKEAAEKGILWIFNIGVNRWASEVLFILWIERYSAVYDLGVPTEYFGYQVGQTARNLWVMVGIAVAYRVVAFVLLVSLNRQKQK
ncbi:hypothetical protein BJ741DRAFT_637718 [Chytriomyces cf. hyalinus JEL632]|nr:hypothetical protein BJ741DRAFT_637718 [Chytriomyces cf. hyalinus JEL632]